ncbi:hypothetical protein PC129_g2604 [Phytophthora cactorum]|uniref:Uncharacterized protein n=1 Tax=Phytophthora cactorum TaxID=29920 RepID=A0A8T1IRX0_9STRA|nr:hypothetical protein PC129_g2604 [Phytophthora cactorum]
MISFDTFSGPRARVREADLDSEGLLILAEQPTPQPELFPPPSDSSDDEFYESQDDSDSLHERDDVDDVAGLAQNAGHPAKEQGRIRQLVELLTLQSHNVGDARSALVDKLLGVVKVNELVLTRATEEQIANAANDAITDEILASVDQEERRRNELAVKDQEMVPASTSTLEQLSPFRVLELVDVLDSTTGGMVKRVLTKVRRRAPLNARMERDNEMDRAVEFCSNSSAPLMPNEGQSSGVYVLSYAEGHSVVPARILKYMRLLMHHEVSTNAFSVVVRFDPRPSHWELMKPGMVSPRSLPSSPTLSHQLQKRMAHYTLQTLLGARDKLRELDTARRKLEQIQAQRRKNP